MCEKKGLSKANSGFVRWAYCRHLATVSKIFATLCVKRHNVSRQCMEQVGCVHQTLAVTEV
jgi:RNase P protein component